MPIVPRVGDYPARLSVRVREEDKHRLEEFAYRARRPNGYVLQRALDLYEADLQANESSTSKDVPQRARKLQSDGAE